MTSRYPELAGLATAVAEPVVLDGEIVAFAGGRPSFSRLQQRMQVGSPPPALVAAVPVTYLIFDLLHINSWSLLDLPYAERRQRLEQLDLAGPAWQTPPAWIGDGRPVLAASREQDLEGVVAKRLRSPYQPGRRSRDWIKTRNVRTQEAVIGGWNPGQGPRAGSIGSLLLGIPHPPGAADLDAGAGMRYVGNVGTGFTAAMLADLTRRLGELQQAASPFTAGAGVPREHARSAHWVTPALVGEVAYTEWTPDGTLRHPSWRGLRPDKRPPEVRLEPT